MSDNIYKSGELVTTAADRQHAQTKAAQHEPAPAATQLPDSWNWQGKVPLGATRNQQVPQYCGSCWANALASTLEDRFSVATGGKVLPRVSVQDIIDSTAQHGCSGGTPASALKAMETTGVVPETCKPYMACSKYVDAYNADAGLCDAYAREKLYDTRCFTCSGFPTIDTGCTDALDISNSCCNPVSAPPLYTIESHKVIADACIAKVTHSVQQEQLEYCQRMHPGKSGVAVWNDCDLDPVFWATEYRDELAQCEKTDDTSDVVGQMKHAIHAGGPIACTINNDPIKNYSGGVFDDNNASKATNHVVEVVGWEGDAWVARNSWGSFYGDDGFFRIKMGENQLGIESQCTYPVVSAANLPGPSYCHEDGSGCKSG